VCRARIVKPLLLRNAVTLNPRATEAAKVEIYSNRDGLRKNVPGVKLRKKFVTGSARINAPKPAAARNRHGHGGIRFFIALPIARSNIATSGRIPTYATVSQK